MTKFESICESYSGAREEFKKYRNECHLFANDLWKGIIYHFQIPYSQLSYYKLDDEGEYESVPAPFFNTLSLVMISTFLINFIFPPKVMNIQVVEYMGVEGLPLFDHLTQTRLFHHLT